MPVTLRGKGLENCSCNPHCACKVHASCVAPASRVERDGITRVPSGSASSVVPASSSSTSAAASGASHSMSPVTCALTRCPLQRLARTFAWPVPAQDLQGVRLRGREL